MNRSPEPPPDGQEPLPVDATEVPDATDARMAEFLRTTTNGAELRRELQRDGGDAANDLLARLNALDFVQQVVGSPSDLPTRIGEYLVKGVLGRGGMGTVYLGYQEELEREVALKVLAPNYASDPTMRKRFRAEARATAALHHRHIVPIYDYGEAQGMLFFAMERVDGLSLDKHITASRRLERRPMEPLDAARRFAGVADALGLAHRRRLLHRDVKPGNILVGADGTLALTDFGLAMVLDHASMRLTSKGGGFLGTLHYASPEQALGAELTPASDLYSLGVTMFEAISGELPIAAKTTEALLQAILHGTPRRLRDVLPKPPRDLEAVVDKLLMREPGDRYQDGEALSRDLQRIADGEPVHIRRLPLYVRVWRRMRKNPVLSGALVAACVLLVVTLSLANVLRREKGQSLVSRHQNNLVAIARDIGREAGPPAGPLPLLQALVGLQAPVVAPSPSVMQAIDFAAKEVPDDEQVAALRTAYVEAAAPRASAFLRDGRGFEALQVYEAAIVQAVAARTGGDLAVEVELYGLYLGRGIANLTAAVARPNDARIDLALASYLRPGATFPQTLLTVLDLIDSVDVERAAAQLERELAAPAVASERVRVFGGLLWAIAGLEPPVDGNLMDFGLGYQRRRVLHGTAMRLLSAPPAGWAGPRRPTGLAGRFASACGNALQRLGETTVLRELAENAERDLGNAVHAESPLQGWRAVLQLLLQSRPRGPLVDRDQQPLAPSLQLAAWDDLLSLSPTRDMMRLWLARFEELRLNHPGLPGLARVAARVHALARSDEALALAQQWLLEADGDPEAQLCRMGVLLRAGRVGEAMDDAMVAVQSSVVPTATLREVVRTCNEVLAETPAAAATPVRGLAERFRALLDGPQAGGR
ncbi:MAG: serine/threonine protein kinase [Planctomycetes bacterium]|nr:serine/threonine protein kinase [Planctomycetota bacterium]MCC7397613.1 serine/threonine protein kinase [Planctomycetota bacterium]